MSIEQSAQEIIAGTERGADRVTAAAMTATEGMLTMLGNLKTPEGKAEALKHYAEYMGMAAEYERTIVPMTKGIVEDLSKQTKPEIADIMSKLWVARVMKALHDDDK